MLPKYLKIEGFRSYIAATINFEQLRPISCIVGQNGHGKSTILEAITTALYWRNNCTAKNGVGMDNCINTNCDKFALSFCFTMGGHEYVINTGKVRGETRWLELYIDGTQQTEKVNETQAKILNILQMDYDTYLDTACLGQGKSSAFAQKTPAERKQTLLQILDADKYEQYSARAKEMKKECKSKIDSVQQQIELLQGMLCDVEQERKVISDNEQNLLQKNKKAEQIKNAMAELQAGMVDISDKLRHNQMVMQNRVNCQKQVQAAGNNLSVCNDKLQALQIEDIKTDYADQISKCKQTIDSLKQQIALVKVDIGKMQVMQNQNNVELTKAKNKLDKFLKCAKDVCELCGNVITPAHRQAHIDNLQKQCDIALQQQEEYARKIALYNQRGKQLSTQGAEQSKNLQQLEKEKNKQEEYVKLQEQRDLFKQQLDNANNMLQQANAMQLYDCDEQANKDRQNQLVKLKKQLTEIEHNIADSNQSIAIAKHKIEDYGNNEQKIKKMQGQLSELKQKHSDYNAVANAFGKNGIPAAIIAHDLPAIEQETNAILNILSDGALSMRYVTKTQGKNKMLDTLDILIKDATSERPYETYSGGEQYRVDFACHVGMAKYLTRRCGASIDCLLVDEGLGSQDESAKQRFVDIINRLSKFIPQIIVITHLHDMQNQFAHKLIVSKHAVNGSTITVV